MQAPDHAHAPLASFRAAVSFLTRLPVGDRGDIGPTDIGNGVIYFPLVGAAVGGAIAVTAWAASLILPVTAAAIFGVGAGVLLTGAIHADGLADTADGYGASNRARALEIMHDHQLGTYGVLAVAIDVGLRVALLAALLAHPRGLTFLVAAGALSRASAVGAGALFPKARVDGLHSSVLKGVNTSRAVLALVIGLAIALISVGWLALPGALAASVATALWGWHCHRRLGGMTGDTLGAASEFSELLVLALGSGVIRAGGAG
jgi:adenosylcobinamide-GDP ribazoletransferase